jgi:hypothetical protein
LFQSFPSIRVDSAEFIGRLNALQPRFYSIASSEEYYNQTQGEKPGKIRLDILFNIDTYLGPGKKIKF